jgi:O-antigen/teichoic acid export membrane protein
MIGVGPMFAMSAAGLDDAEVGVFSVALRLGALVSLVSVVFNMVWQEKRFSESNETGTSSFISSLHPVFMVAVASVFVGSLVALIYYSFFVSIDFNKGLSIVPLILISSALLMVSNHCGSELLANNSSFNVAASSIIGGFLAMLSSYALTASCGMSAGALGSILGALIMILIRVKSLSIWSVFLSLVRKNIISIILLLGYTLFVSKNGFDLYNSILAIFATLFLTYNLLVFKKNTNI